MAIKSIKGEFGKLETVFLGGTTVLNVLGEVSSNSASMPQAWTTKLDDFIKCSDGGSFQLCGHDIIKTGFYVKAKGIEFKETEHGNKGPAYWELANHANTIPKTQLASIMRTVLSAPATKADAWPATLIAAMFLSEVVRNPRSFIVNLMLLDLIEKGVKYGSAETKELDFASLLTFKPGKAKTYEYATGAVAVGGKDGAAGTVRGGKLPMSQLDAMKQYQTTTADKFDYQKTFTNYAKQSHLTLQASTETGVAYQFPNALLEKECTIVLRWLLAYFAKSPLKYVTGQTVEKRNMPAVWGKPPSVQDVTVNTTDPVKLTGLKSHVREKTWTDASTLPLTPNPKVLVDSCRTALRARQSAVVCLL